MHEVENKKRQLINMVMIRSLELNWCDNYTSEKIKNKYNSRSVGFKKTAPKYNNVSGKLLSIDTDDLLDIILYKHKNINMNKENVEQISDELRNLVVTGDVK